MLYSPSRRGRARRVLRPPSRARWRCLRSASHEAPRADVAPVRLDRAVATPRVGRQFLVSAGDEAGVAGRVPGDPEEGLRAFQGWSAEVDRRRSPATAPRVWGA